MALVNPNIAMSYRPTVEYQPRNALADYAQVQQIMGGQRQMEVADMQLEQMRRKDQAISQIQAAAAKNGGPTDRREIARAYLKSGVPEFIQFGLTLEKDLDELDAFQRIMGGGAAPATGGGAQPAARGKAPTFPIAGKDVPMGTIGSGTFDSAQINNIGTGAQQPPRLTNVFNELPQGAATGLNENQMAAFVQANPYEQAALDRALPSMKIPGVSAGQVPAFSQLSRDLLSPETRAAQDLGYDKALPASAFASAAQANALAPTAPPANVNQLASATGAAPAAATSDAIAALQDRRNKLLALGTPRALQAAQSIDKDIALMSKTTTASPGSVVYDARGNVIATVPAAPTAPRVEIIGVAKGTDTPVYVDKNTDTQFTIGIDASGKQTRVPYTGGVNRSTSTVTAPVDVKVNAFVPASETAQAEYMKGARTTFEALRNAQPTLDNIEKAKALVPGAKGFMGTGGEPLLAAASFLNNRLGTSINTTGVTDAQELRSRLFFGILDNLKKLDSQPSQQQQMALQQALGSIGTDPTALPRVLDAFGDSIRTKVDLYNADVTSAEDRGVKFPYKPQIQLKPRAPLPGESAAQTPGAAPAIPQAAIDALKAGRGTDAQFDAIFGAGAAKRARGQ
jgi:hypothetical protein